MKEVQRETGPFNLPSILRSLGESERHCNFIFEGRDDGWIPGKHG